MNISILENAIGSESAMPVDNISQDVGTFQAGCYCLYCNANGRFYIGSSAYMGQRKSNHFSMLAQGRHSNGAIQKDYNLHGKSAFVFFVLENCDTIDLEKTERRLIASLKSQLMYNSNSFVHRSNRTHLENALIPIRETSANSMTDKMNKPHRSEGSPEGSLSWLAGIVDANYDTLYRKARRNFPEIKWSATTELTPEHIRVLSAGYSVPDGLLSGNSVVTEDIGRVLIGDVPPPRPAISAKRAPRAWTPESGPNGKEFREALPEIQKEFSNQPAPAENTPTPGRAKFTWPSFHQVRRFLISALLFTVVVMHGLLIWYDCAVLWDIPGQIGGGTVFIVVLAALLLASDATLPRTSGNALAFIFFVDCAAWKVHFEVFKTPVVDNILTGSLCAFICAASFIALYLFRDSKLD